MWRSWRARRLRGRRARAYVAALLQEPRDADVAWLAAHATAGDSDHARWELRYARRALGLVTARRDALDDETASLVAHALATALDSDPAVDPRRRAVAQQQFNLRLRAYGDALADRSELGTGQRLARSLLELAGRGHAGADSRSEADLAGAAALLERYLSEANALLRDQFGAPDIAEVIQPPRRAVVLSEPQGGGGG